jgi:hypothetical protein
MRGTLISILISLVWTIPTAARDMMSDRGAQQAPANQAPAGQSAGGQSAGGQSTRGPSTSGQSIVQNFRSNLARAGYTDIRMVPNSFVVRAQDPNGVAVMLVLSPDSITVLTEAAPAEASGLPPDQAPDAGTPAPDRCVPPNAEGRAPRNRPPIELTFDMPVAGARLD